MSLFDDAAERFENEMRWAVLNNDCEESRHIAMDDIMCEILEEFGCHAGVKIFKETLKWYS